MGWTWAQVGASTGRHGTAQTMLEVVKGAAMGDSPPSSVSQRSEVIPGRSDRRSALAGLECWACYRLRIVRSFCAHGRAAHRRSPPWAVYKTKVLSGVGLGVCRKNRTGAGAVQLIDLGGVRGHSAPRGAPRPRSPLFRWVVEGWGIGPICSRFVRGLRPGSLCLFVLVRVFVRVLSCSPYCFGLSSPCLFAFVLVLVSFPHLFVLPHPPLGGGE